MGQYKKMLRYTGVALPWQSRPSENFQDHRARRAFRFTPTVGQGYEVHDLLCWPQTPFY